MTIADALSRVRAWIADHEQRRALASFTCAHCDKNAQCCREPTSDCLEKHEQIAQDDSWRHRPRANLTARLPYS